MQFSSFADFISMGGHGFYVWLSYSTSVFLLLLLVFMTKANDKRVKQQIKNRIKREAKLKLAAALAQQSTLSSESN